MRQKKITRPRDRADSENRLLEAAKEVFSELGYDGATTRMVAEKAGVNLALITRYFGNKHGLLVALVKQEARDFHALPLPYPPQKTLAEEGLKFVETLFSLYLSHIDWLRIVLVQLMTDRDFAKEVRRDDFLDSQTNIEERIAPYFKRGTKASQQKELRAFVDTLQRNALSSLIIQFLIAGEPKERCLEDLKALTAAYCKVF